MNCVTVPMTLGRLHTIRNGINEFPDYQREGGVWSRERQQLFLDSLLNQYDIPKIYFHDLSDQVGGRFSYAIIDGKQRLTTVWSFFDGTLSLADDFELNDALRKSPEYRGLPAPPTGAGAWASMPPDWQEILKGITLDIVKVKTDDMDEIEELFFRLNNGEPLNAAEKRNNIRGDMTDLIRQVSELPFFKDKVRINSRRYKHREVAAKMVALEWASYKGGNEFADLKKKHLDDLCVHHAAMPGADKTGLMKRVDKVLRDMGKVFEDRDPLLGKMATPPLYYAWVKRMHRLYGHPEMHTLLREFLRSFELRRVANLGLDEDQQNPGLIEYTRLSQQATNDRGNIKSRCVYLMRDFLRDYPEVERKDAKRLFSEEERYVIFELGNRECAECGAFLSNLDAMEADHIVQWSFGGATSLSNARCLCEGCNSKLRAQLK